MGHKPATAKKVVNILTGEIFDSARVAADANGIIYNTLSSKLRGDNANNTPFRYLNSNWEEKELLPKPPKSRHITHARKVINTETQQVYICIADAAEAIGMRHKNLCQKLSGKRPNNTPFRYFQQDLEQ